MTTNNSTPVIFKVDDLITKAREILAIKARADKEWEAAKAKWQEREREQWLEQRTPNVRKLRDYLTKCLRTGTPPIYSELSGTLSGTHSYRNSSDNRIFYEPGSANMAVQTPQGYHVNTEDLAALVAMLEAHQGETISATQLRSLGFKGRAVISLFRDVANAENARRRAAEKAVS